MCRSFLCLLLSGAIGVLPIVPETLHGGLRLPGMRSGAVASLLLMSRIGGFWSVKFGFVVFRYGAKCSLAWPSGGLRDNVDCVSDLLESGPSVWGPARRRGSFLGALFG